MRELIIFGRSPFINNINVLLLCSQYETLGFNHFGKLYPVDYLFSLNEYNEPKFIKTQVFGNYELSYPTNVKLIQLQCSANPLFNQCYAWQAFSVSPAINWAIVENFTDIYLVGIDHIETDKKFIHNDGIDDKRGQNMNPSIHKLIKEYIYRCTKYINIFQCNPNVKKDWELPFKSVEQLYKNGDK